MTGQAALITVEHKSSAKGRTYANVKGITPLPPQMAVAAPGAEGYTRAEYIEERKKAYAQESRTFRKAANAPPAEGESFEDYSQDDDDSSLPF